MTPMLEIRALDVRFDLPGGAGLHAVRGIDVVLRPRERLALVGESGCGKTTALLAVMGLLPPTATLSGMVVLDGNDILELGEESARRHRWRDIAMVFQGAMSALDPVRRVGDQIVAPMQLHEVAEGSTARRRMVELLGLVGVPDDRQHAYPHELSGGMKQRVSIAMALACEPRILLADEPTTALDVMAQAQILDLLVSLSDTLGLGVILVTHDLPVVLETCSRASVMYAGRIVETARVEQLRSNAAHPYTRALFTAIPDVSRRERLQPIPGLPPRLDTDVRGCAFRPRCSQAFDACSAEPDTVEIGSWHGVACHGTAR